MLAAGALPVQKPSTPERDRRLHHAAVQVDEGARAARGDSHLLALLLGSEALHELRLRQPLLELDSIRRHGAALGWKRPSSSLRGALRLPAELHRQSGPVKGPRRPIRSSTLAQDGFRGRVSCRCGLGLPTISPIRADFGLLGDSGRSWTASSRGLSRRLAVKLQAARGVGGHQAAQIDLRWSWTA